MGMPRLLVGLLLLLAVDLSSIRAGDTQRGDRIRDAYFRKEAQKLGDASLAGIKNRADWERLRPELRREFLDMLGLWPLPARTDLHVRVTGKIESPHFVVEKILFQSLPGLYVTANLYLPKTLTAPAPAILYLCGHSSTVVDKISYGGKVNYQSNAAWYAENGYVCLIVDTLQLGEIQGIHHGTANLGMWWWQTLGYTPAGIECWNAMRALDYLESRREVDPRRLGVTGRSGGGATSWWVAAADERVQCIVPVAGIADLRAHVSEGAPGRFQDGVISGHCDCMYFVNTYRWDFDKVMALCAPRPLLLGNSDNDDIFPVPGYRRLAEKVRRIYDLYGAGDRFALLETAGPHKDTPELRQGTFRWMNRWLKKDNAEVADPDRPRLTPQQLRVIDRLPDDAANATIHETFRKPARIDLPQTSEVVRAWWQGQRPQWLQALRQQVFGGWPKDPQPLDIKAAEDIRHQGQRLRAFDFNSEAEVPLRLWLLTADTVEKPTLVVLTAVEEGGWQEMIGELGPAFQTALQLARPPILDPYRFQQNGRTLTQFKWAFATVAPRGIGPTRWTTVDANGKSIEHQIRRRFALLGQTLDGQRVWDVRRAIEALRTIPGIKEAPLWLQGKGDMAGVVLYASLFEPNIARLDLWYPPASHQQGPIFLNIRRILDMPQAVALAYPSKVRLYVKDDADKRAWDWPLQFQQAMGQDFLQIRTITPPELIPAPTVEIGERGVSTPRPGKP